MKWKVRTRLILCQSASLALLAENISGDALPEADGTKDLLKSRVSSHEGLSPLRLESLFDILF